MPPSLHGGASWVTSRNPARRSPSGKMPFAPSMPAVANVFFPSSRSEVPFWLNQKSIFEDAFDTTERYSQTLDKPIYVEHGVDLFAQWLLGVLTESRTRVALVPNSDNPSQASLNPVPHDILTWLNASNNLNCRQSGAASCSWRLRGAVCLGRQTASAKSGCSVGQSDRRGRA